MHDNRLEDRVRGVLRAEGDALPVTITREELERRLSARRRQRMSRRFSLVAAVIGVVALGSALLWSGGWLRPADVGSAPSPGPGVDTGHAQVPTISIPSDATKSCVTIDPATMTEPPDLLMGVTPGNARVWGGLGSSYRLGDNQAGEEGTWDHDTIGFEAVSAGYPAERLRVLASDPDACLVGLEVDARRSDRMDDEPIRFAELTSQPSRVLEFDKPPAGDWFVRVHADFETITGTGAWRETFFAIEVPDCTPLDPASADTPPAIGLVSGFEGTGATHAGTKVASAWNGQTSGSPGTWDGLTADPDQVVTAPGFDGLQITATECLIDVQADVLLTVFAQVPEPAPTPIDLQVRRGEGSPVVDLVPPATGGWTLRVRANFLTVDRTEAWSETLFRVISMFPAPGLTVEPDFFEVMSDAHCPNFQLASGASAADQCGGAYELMEGRDPITIASGAPIAFRLEDDWIIGEARTIAVNAELIAAGDFAPEYSVDFQETVGDTLTVPIRLDPGSWILRISLNGSRNGDTFGAWYDIAVTVTP